MRDEGAIVIAADAATAVKRSPTAISSLSTSPSPIRRAPPNSVMGQAASRAMKLSGGGSIVNIAGVSGLMGNAGRSAYGASNGGVVMLSMAMATDLAPLGIRVNVIAPGPVDSPHAERLSSPHARKRWTDAIPLERYARPDEIAGPQSSFVRPTRTSSRARSSRSTAVYSDRASSHDTK